MLIKHVRIENFKRFERLDIDLRPFDCLVGPNNCGKTTLLQALALFDFCVHHSLSSRNGGRIELKSRTISPEEFYVLPIANPTDLWTDRKAQGGRRHKVISVALTFEGGAEVVATVDLSYNRFGVSIETEDHSSEWLQRLREIRISYLPVFSMFLPQEERRTSAVIEDDLARGQVNRVIRNLLFNLKQEGHETELVEILQRIFPSLDDMKVEFDEVNDRYISVNYREKGHPKEFDVFSAGSGFHQFVYLFGFILLRNPTVILLDEPDVHLHGSLQGVLLEELKRLVNQGKQVLFATHSRELITRMNPDNILYLEESNPRRLSIAYDIYDTLDRLGSMDLAQLPVLQAYRRVLVVEDQSDEKILKAFCSTILGASIWQQVERRVAICYAKGNPWKQDMARLRQQLQQMITLTGQQLEMFVVADRDYHPYPEELRESVQNRHLQFHIWQKVEIENYLLSLNGIFRVMGESDQQMTLYADAIRQEFERLLEDSRNTANDRLVKAFDEYGRSKRLGWDPVTVSRNAREYLQEHWNVEKIALADAKELVLPGIKRWLQDQRLGQFSDQVLAEALQPEDLPEEVHDLARGLAHFAGVEWTRKPEH